MPGVVGIEIGRAWSTTPAGWAATPEVLVRVLEGSSAAAKLAQVLPRARSLPGRRGDERVVRLRPRAGTRASTFALTRGARRGVHRPSRRRPRQGRGKDRRSVAWLGRCRAACRPADGCREGVLEPTPARMDSNAPGVHPQHALAVYAESLAAGARVAVFGDASLGLGARLVELGARAVHLWDPDADRARSEAERAPRGVTVHAYAEQERGPAADRPRDRRRPRPLRRPVRHRPSRAPDGRRGGRRDHRRAEAPKPVTRRARAASRRSRSFDYYDLFDLVAPEFESVRMVAQLPFHGVALVELGDEDEAPGVNVDTQLGESGRAPEAFVVVASQRGARLEPYTIVQLASPSPFAPERGEGTDEAVANGLAIETTSAHADRAAIEAARAADRDALAAGAASNGAPRRPARRPPPPPRRRARRRPKPWPRSRSRSVPARRTPLELESILRRARARARSSSRRRSRRCARPPRRGGSPPRRWKRWRCAPIAPSAASPRSSRSSRRAATRSRRSSPTWSSVLRERSQAVRALEVEVARRDQMVRDLVGTLEELEGRAAPPPPDARAPCGAARARTQRRSSRRPPQALAEENARLRAQLDALALDLARREGEAQATAWQVDGARAAPGPGRRAVGAGTRPGRGPTARLAQALDQLDALRAALAQEHEARDARGVGRRAGPRSRRNPAPGRADGAARARARVASAARRSGREREWRSGEPGSGSSEDSR